MYSFPGGYFMNHFKDPFFSNFPDIFRLWRPKFSTNFSYFRWFVGWCVLYVLLGRCPKGKVILVPRRWLENLKIYNLYIYLVMRKGNPLVSGKLDWWHIIFWRDLLNKTFWKTSLELCLEVRVVDIVVLSGKAQTTKSFFRVGENPWNISHGIHKELIAWIWNG